MTESTSSPMVAEREDERGYILAMTALLLIPLLVFAAFAVDVGAWYAQAARTQRAADAAALAAVVWMPDEERATQAALDVAARNGFVHGSDSNITVERVGDQQVRVRIESEGEVYFGAPVMDGIDIERFAVAEYVLPVPMGNPSSAIGTGNIAGGNGVWLAINGICQARRQGDPFSARRWGDDLGYCNTDGSYGGTANDNYDPEGYIFVVDVPEGSGPINVQVYEPGLCGGDTGDSTAVWGDGPRLDFRLYANDETPLSDQDNLDRPPIANTQFSRTDCTGGISGDNRWYSVFTIPGGNPGRWFLRVRGISHETPGIGMSSDRVAGLNGFAIRLARGSNATTCSSLNDSTCPQIFAKDWLSVYRPNLGNGAANFYLAEISGAHAGKKVEIQLFDAGEGMENIQILSPDGTSLDFEWQYYTCGMLNTNCPDSGLQSADLCGSTPCLRTRENDPNSDPPGDPDPGFRDRFQDRAARIIVDLPADYDCDGQTHCWWQLRYEPRGNQAPTDRTTWGVRVIGDPVRLTE